MGTLGHIELSIPVIWHYTSEVRQAVDTVMQGHAGPLRQATQMVASELVENALKYGQATPEIQQIRFSLWLNEQEIVIEVTNGVCDRAALAEFEARIATIKQSDDKEELLLSRMQEIFARPTFESQLGLYRIASEGGFQLEYNYNVSALTVRATRKIHGQ